MRYHASLPGSVVGVGRVGVVGVGEVGGEVGKGRKEAGSMT